MSEITRAPIVIDGLPDLFVGFTSWEDALVGILRYAYAEVPNSISNVIISNKQPDDGQTDYVWGKLDNAGNFLGFAVFAQGDWRVIATPTPAGQLSLLAGDSDNPPSGFAVANAALVGADNLAKLQAQWNPPGDGTSTTDGPWTLFHVVYTGF